MPNKCPLCLQVLPKGVHQHELDARLNKLTSPFLVEARKKIEEEANQKVEERVRREVKTATARAEKEAREKVQKESQSYIKKQVAAAIHASQEEKENLKEKLARERRLRAEETTTLKSKVEDLERTVEKQRSDQLGAEAQADLLTELQHAFSHQDKIEVIPRGIKGADIVQHVMDGDKVAGRIIYESKNTLGWDDKWITRAKEYQREYETPHVMIVSRVLPGKLKGMCEKKGIPVIEGVRIAVSFATVLRAKVIEIAKLRLSNGSSAKKHQDLFNYMTGDKFGTRFREMADCISTLDKLQHDERNQHENMWEKESKIHAQIERGYREIDAQIRTITTGASNGKALKVAA
jgi:hypothetical protein